MTDYTDQTLLHHVTWITDNPGLATRIRHLSRNHDIHSVGQLRAMTNAELLRIPELGKAALACINRTLGQHSADPKIVRLRRLLGQVRRDLDRIDKILDEP